MEWTCRTKKIAGRSGSDGRKLSVVQSCVIHLPHLTKHWTLKSPPIPCSRSAPKIPPIYTTSQRKPTTTSKNVPICFQTAWLSGQEFDFHSSEPGVTTNLGPTSIQEHRYSYSACVSILCTPENCRVESKDYSCGSELSWCCVCGAVLTLSFLAS